MGQLGVTSVSVLRSDLVPVYSFGENDAYKQVIFEEGSYWRIWQKRLQKLLGFAPCLFHGCGLFFSSSWGIVPFCKPITTIGELVLFWDVAASPGVQTGVCWKLASFPFQLESQSQCQKFRIPQRRWWMSITRCTSSRCWTSLISTRPGLGWKRAMSCISSERLMEPSGRRHLLTGFVFFSPVSFIQSAQLCMLHSLCLCLAKPPRPPAAVGSCYITSRVRTRCLFLLRLSQCRGWPSPGAWKRAANEISSFFQEHQKCNRLSKRIRNPKKLWTKDPHHHTDRVALDVDAHGVNIAYNARKYYL